MTNFRIKNFNQYQKDYTKSIEDPDSFWNDIAENFTWKKKWTKVHSGDFNNLDIKWFEGAQLNITENCLDRHLEKFGQKTAIIWEPNDPNEKSKEISYQELYESVCNFSNVLINNGIQKGDVVCIYMPMIPELAIAVLACARIGAIHSVVFGGFSSNALADRINDAQCSLILTADSVMRGEKEIKLKNIVDEALLKTPSIKKCITFQRTGNTINMEAGRDTWWHEEIEKENNINEAAIMDAEDPLFILYTSGSTGKPKGILHTTAGYMVFAGYSFENVFQYEANDTYWCTADIGWITGHSYIVYGPLLQGATTLMFEGIPTFPDPGRFWDVVDKHKVNIFYTAPTAIRSLQATDLKYVLNKDLSSLKVLGSVGEPINEEAWQWYFKNIGKGKCPIVDTWWQTETGGVMIAPLAGITKEKPSYATLPLPGVKLEIVDNDGKTIAGNNVEGNLCITQPWPSQARTIYGDHDRFKQTYFSTYDNKYFTGDGCKRDSNGYYKITGRVDDVMNVSGHRIGTAEVENAIDEHKSVCETAVVGYPHDIKGQGIYAYVLCFEPPQDEQIFIQEVNKLVTKIIGPFARPDKIQIVTGLPKTRSGKIMRRILRKIAEGDTAHIGDTSTLLDPSVVENIKKGAFK